MAIAPPRPSTARAAPASPRSARRRRGRGAAPSRAPRAASPRARRRRRRAGSRRPGRTGPASPVEQVGLDELDREPEPLGVLAGERERLEPRDPWRSRLRTRVLVGDRRARSRRRPCPTSTTRGASSAAIAASARSTTISVSGPRDERSGVGSQCQAPEPPLAEDVGERLTPAATLDERRERRPARPR